MKDKQHHPFLRILNNRKGVSAILVAFFLPIFIGFAALAIDVGYMYATKNELQNVADAAALAGAGELGRIYLNNGTHNPSDDQQIRDEAKFVSVPEDEKNQAAGKSITPIDDDIEIGVWDWQNSLFVTYDEDDEDKYPPDAVRVTARTQGPVSTFFAKILNFFDFEISAVATAALSGPSTVAEGVINAPVGLSKNNFPDNCENLIIFSGTPDSCAGWHNYFETKVSTSKMRDKQLNIIAGHTVPDGSGISPPDGIYNGVEWLGHYFGTTATPDVIGDVNINDDEKNQFNFIGGESSLLESIRLEWTGEYNDQTPTLTGTGQIASFPALFDYFRMRDGDGDNSIWTATLPVYDDGVACNNPSGFTDIIGFAKAEISGYSGPPKNEIYLTIACEIFEIDDGRGGGGTFGNIKGSIPNLVE
jgi:hypothetical protein